MKRSILVIVCVSLIAQFGLFFYLKSISVGSNSLFPVIEGDSSLYASLAHNLVAHHTFAWDEKTLTPIRHYAVGYPAFLAVSEKIFGSFVPAVFLQIFLLALASVLIFLMARKFLPDWVSLIPALIFSLDPSIIFLNTTVMTDGFFASLLIILVYVVFFNKKWRDWTMFLCAGLLLGYMTLVRPIAEYLVIFLPLIYFLLVRFDKKTILVARRKSLVVFLIGFVLVVSPWMIRNKNIFNHYQIVNDGGFLLYNAQIFLTWKEMWSHGTHLYILLSRHTNTPEYVDTKTKITSDLNKLTPKSGSVDDYMGALAKQYILADPISYTYFHLANSLPIFFGGSFSEYLRNVNSLRSAPAPVISFIPKLLETGFQILVFIFALAGSIAAFRRRHLILVVFACLIIYFTVLTGPIGNARYRTPIQPFLLILATYGACVVIENTRFRFKKEIRYNIAS